MRKLKMIFILLLFNATVFSNGIFETFEVDNKDPFNGIGILNWIGDVGDFLITSAGWPRSPSPDFLGNHSLRAQADYDLNSTILTSISSFYDPNIKTRWEVFVSGGSTEITENSKGFSLILFVNSNDITAIENGTVDGYRLRLCDPGLAYPDGLYFEKASGSGWFMVDSIQTGNAKINQGWTLTVERDIDGNWWWGYSNGPYNADVVLTKNFTDQDFTTGSYAGINWYSIASDAGSFGFDNFKVDPYTPGMWREDASTGDWHTATNWEDGNVPLGSTNVQIANTDNYPLINENAVCNNLTILAGASLTINLNKTLTVHGDFLLESNVNGDGSIIDDGGFMVNGSSIIQRYLAHYNSGSNEFHFLSIPIGDHLVENSLRYCFVYPYNETTNGWYSLSEGDNLNKGNGYSVYYSGDEDFIIQFTGMPNTGNQVIPVSASNFSGNSLNDNWNLIGNPFPSSIDWDQINKVNIESAIYIWNPATLTYSSYVDGVGSNMNNDGIIPPMQAFFVHAISTGNLSIPQSSRTNNHNQNYLKLQDSDQKLLKIRAGKNGKRDETIIRIKAEATAGFDALFDAYKLLPEETNDGIQIYSLGKDEEKLSINTVPDQDSSMDFRLGIVLETADSIEIEFHGIPNILNNKDLFLEDLGNNQYFKLINDTVLNFYCLPEDEDRFMIHFIPQITGINESIIEKPKVWVKDGFIHVVLHDQGSSNIGVHLYDLSGRLIYSEIIKNRKEFFIKKPIRTGIYILRIQNHEECLNYKVFINN